MLLQYCLNYVNICLDTYRELIKRRSCRTKNAAQKFNDNSPMDNFKSNIAKTIAAGVVYRLSVLRSTATFSKY